MAVQMNITLHYISVDRIKYDAVTFVRTWEKHFYKKEKLNGKKQEIF
jgi:hypothetical protein